MTAASPPVPAVVLAAASEGGAGFPIGYVYAVLVAAGIASLLVYLHLRRTGALAARAFARAHSLEYAKRDDTVLGWTAAPLRAGSRRRAYDIVRGAHRGKYLLSFRLQYRKTDHFKGDDDGKVTVNRRVAGLAMPGPLPLVTFTPRTTMARARTAMAGTQTVQVELGAFNDRWIVSAADAKAAHALLSPRVIEALMDPYLAHQELVVEGHYAMVVTDNLTDWALLDRQLVAVAAAIDSATPYLFADGR